MTQKTIEGVILCLNAVDNTFTLSFAGTIIVHFCVVCYISFAFYRSHGTQWTVYSSICFQVTSIVTSEGETRSENVLKDSLELDEQRLVVVVEQLFVVQLWVQVQVQVLQRQR